MPTLLNILLCNLSSFREHYINKKTLSSFLKVPIFRVVAVVKLPAVLVTVLAVLAILAVLAVRAVLAVLRV